MSAEKPGLKVLQGPGGRFVRITGQGKPDDVTEEEVAAWQAALRSPPPSGWEGWGELAKWATGILAAVTFLTLACDWALNLGKFSVLGAPELTALSFSSSPIHFDGAALFAAISVGLLVEGWLLWQMDRASRALLRKVPAAKPILQQYYIPAVTLLLFLAIWVQESLGKQSPLWIFLILSSCYLLGIYAILDREPNRWFTPQGKRILGVFLITVFGLLVYILVPFASGSNQGQAVLAGRATFPGVCLVTRSELALPKPAAPNHYCSELIALPGGQPVLSLQYLGSNDQKVYVLETQAGLVHVISMDEIQSYVLLKAEAIQGSLTSMQQRLQPTPTWP